MVMHAVLHLEIILTIATIIKLMTYYNIYIKKELFKNPNQELPQQEMYFLHDFKLKLFLVFS